jgi:hypothetical protein
MGKVFNEGYAEPLEAITGKSLSEFPSNPGIKSIYTKDNGLSGQ